MSIKEIIVETLRIIEFYESVKTRSERVFVSKRGNLLLPDNRV